MAQMHAKDFQKMESEFFIFFFFEKKKKKLNNYHFHLRSGIQKDILVK